MKRASALLLAGVVGLGACADNRAVPLAPETTAPTFSQATLSAEASERHLVVLSGTRVPGDFAGRVASLGGTVELAYGQIGVAVVSGLSSDAAAALLAHDDVRYVEMDEEIQVLDPQMGGEAVAAEIGTESGHPSGAPGYARQWNMRAIAADQAWAAGRLGSPSVTIAILDTGVDPTYPDLAGRVDLARSRSFVPSDNALINAVFPGAHEVVDLHGHGTHVAATASSNAAIMAGVTSRTTIIGVKVLNARGSGSSAGILAGLMYAVDAGADVVNMSLGGYFLKRDNPGYVSVINRALTYANRNGVTVVVSAGNADMDLDHFSNGYKTYCSNLTVCVSATGPTAGAGVNGPWVDVDARAGYSNYGRSAIDVAAPGGNTGGAVWAACSKFRLFFDTETNTWQWTTCSFFPQTHYIVGMSGTSMASPHVAGLAALMVEQYGRNPARIRAALHQTADDLGQPGTDPYYGKGRINVARGVGL